MAIFVLSKGRKYLWPKYVQAASSCSSLINYCLTNGDYCLTLVLTVWLLVITESVLPLKLTIYLFISCHYFIVLPNLISYDLISLKTFKIQIENWNIKYKVFTSVQNNFMFGYFKLKIIFHYNSSNENNYIKKKNHIIKN